MNGDEGASAGAKSIEAQVKSDLIKIVPSILWFSLALAALVYFHKPIIAMTDRLAVKDISKISVLEVQIEFAQDQLSRSPGADEGAKTTVDLKSKEIFKPYADHIRSLGAKLAGARILWVDDKHPTQNHFERNAFNALGIGVDAVRTNAEVFALLRLGIYDIIISDADRQTGENAVDNHFTCFNGVAEPKGSGCALLRELYHEKGDSMPPTIIYSGRYPEDWGVPPYAFGRTNRVDRLLEYVLAALERRRPPEHPMPIMFQY